MTERVGCLPITPPARMEKKAETVRRKSALRAFICVALGAASGWGEISAAPSLFTFANPADRLAAASGEATLSYFDPAGTNWGEAGTAFGKASGFGIPAINGTDADVMQFPACTPEQGYVLAHAGEANGAYGEGDMEMTSNYTFIMDVYYPAASDGAYRALWQTDMSNGSDADFFIHSSPSGGIGISNNYRGRVTPNTWHRIAIAVRAAPGEGQARRYINGEFVGAQGTTGSGLDVRWALGPEVLLFGDESNETRTGYVSSVYFVDRAMTHEEIVALGGPHADGANVAGPAAPALGPKMVRRVGAIGHRGGSFGAAPDNTLAALNKAFAEGAAGVEVDTRLTSDGIAVCFHDETLERTTNGTGGVADISLALLKELDAGSKYDPAFANERVPTLVEAMNAAKGKGILYLDIKTGGQTSEFKRAIDETGFPVEDIWFWTPNDPDYAAEIRAAIPNAKIFWGAPDASWSEADPAYNPNYFAELKAMGVAGFSYSSANPDIKFCAKAKQQGFIVEVFTILDPDAMRSVAAGGADYMETDFPAIVAALQPEQAAKASGPIPAPDSQVPTTDAILAWVPGQGATAHRIHFGATNPPPFVAQQTSDLFQTPALHQWTNYYWRVDEITPAGTVTGDVWTFNTRPPTFGAVLEWELNGNLDPSMGAGVLAFADGENTEMQTSWETSDDFAVPHINGQPVSYLNIPAFASAADGLALTLTGVAANGGGAFVNKYSFVFDVLLPAGWGWMPFFNTAPANNNDSDFFVNSSGAVGIGDLGYSAGSVIIPDTWHRVIFAADLPAGVVSYYVDGVLVRQRTGGVLSNGRFSLNPGTGQPPHVRLFGDEDGEMSPVYISAVAFVDGTLTAEQAEQLGGVRPDGIFFSSQPSVMSPPSVAVSGGTVSLTWTAAPGRRLQKSSTLLATSWSDIPGTPGQGTYSEPVQAGGAVYYRVAE